MTLMKYIFFFLFTVVSFTSYANDNTYILVGQNGSEGKTAFVLELTCDDLGDNVQISENGEIYLKVDKIIAMPNGSYQNGFVNSYSAEAEENTIECGSRVYRPKRWQCPYCHHWWEMGERCKNEECATNQWEKKEES